jgi:type II secretory pathway component PulJ
MERKMTRQHGFALFDAMLALVLLMIAAAASYTLTEFSISYFYWDTYG